MVPNAGRIVVLHVDDQPWETRLMQDVFSDVTDRFDVRSAHSVEAGLRRLRDPATDISCVVSDYEMPTGDGLEFLERVRAEYPDLPFVLFTGTGSERLASEAIAAGVTDYLQKGGVDAYERLADRVESLVAKYRAEREARRAFETVDPLHDPVGLLDEEGRFTYLNEAYAELYGYEREELLGAHWTRVYPTDEVNRVDDEVRSAVGRGTVWRGETVGLRKDGSRFVGAQRVARCDGGGLVSTVRRTE